MKSALKWSSLGLVVYIIFLIVKLPAVHVLSHIPHPSNIKISGVSGTIWDGHAQSAQVNGLPIKNLRWSLAFFPLLLGEMTADIKAGNIRNVEEISVNGHLRFSGKRLQADDVLAYAPTYLVMNLVTLPIPVQADGRFKVQLNEVDYEAGCQILKGKGQWLNANYSGNAGIVELGSFDADIGCQDGSITVDVKQPNSFGLTATATIPANMQFTIEGRFKPEASLPKEVHQAAQFFGKQDANGYYPIKF